jgi:hypothetical protein
MHGLGMKLLELKLFDLLDVVCIDPAKFIDYQTFEINYDYFKQYKNQLVVIDFSSENQLMFENHVCDQLSKTDINFLLLTYNHTQHQRFARMIYFPYWSLWQLEQGRPTPTYKFSSKTYFLGCMSGQPRPHRIVNYLQLVKKSYRDNISITFLKKPVIARQDDLILTADERIQWNTAKESLQVGDGQTPWYKLPQLIDSYLHLVSETTASKHGVFTTEKTWIPIAAGVPFVMLGNPGTMSFLKQQGVDTYDDVIDHNYYDSEPSTRTRIVKLHAVIDDLVSQGIDKIYDKLVDRTVNNQTKFYNGEFNHHHLEALTNAINKYK